MNQTSRKGLIAAKLRAFRYSLSYIDALPQLTLLGFLVGLLTGIIIVIFRFIIEWSLFLLLPEHTENFEALSPIYRASFIFSGAALLTFLALTLAPRDREVGVSHVMDRIHNHQSKLPFKNWCVQFAGAFTAMVSGQSVGREGPVVHLGAGAASQFGQWLRLPNNSINTLVGCGVAAAISASFDTPMAGVIFAMEVLAIEYTVVGFVPVILASVMGAIVSKAAFGAGVFITVGDTNIASLYEIPFMVLVGFTLSICAGAYIKLNLLAMSAQKLPIVLRLIIAGTLMAAVSAGIPQTMGQGYDTVNEALNGNVVLSGLLIIGLAKLVVTPLIIGLGVPGGLIGPLLVVGACLGGALGHILASLFPQLGASPSFYVMMGMAGMMAAVLNAPLAALVTVLELTYNPNIIFPAMLVIVISCVSTRHLFKVKGIFVEQLGHSKRPLDFGPAKQALRRAGVRSVMDTNFTICSYTLSKQKAKTVLAGHPMWLIIVDEDGRYTHAMYAADLANYLDQLVNTQDEDAEGEPDIELLEIPSRSHLIGAIHESASLYEAMQGFKAQSAQMLYVSGERTPLSGEVKGLITHSAIENYYKPMEFRNAVG